MMQHRSFSTLVIIACVIGLAGCAKTVVQPVTETEKRGLPRPPQVLVYTFAVSPTEVIENQSIIHEFMESQGDMTPEQRLREIGREAAEATAGMAAANVAVSGVKIYRSEHEQMAARSAEQAVAYLSQFFAKEGWIIQAKVKEVKLEDK